MFISLPCLLFFFYAFFLYLYLNTPSLEPSLHIPLPMFLFLPLPLPHVTVSVPLPLSRRLYPVPNPLPVPLVVVCSVWGRGGDEYLAGLPSLIPYSWLVAPGVTMVWLLFLLLLYFSLHRASLPPSCSSSFASSSIPCTATSDPSSLSSLYTSCLGVSYSCCLAFY